MNNESFVFYESAYKQMAILEKRLGAEEAYDFTKAVIEYGLYGAIPEEESNVWLYGFEQTITSISKAKDRYSATVENGKKGGRPSVELNEQEVNERKKELKTWKAVADSYGITEQTLRNKRAEWERAEKQKNPKNLNENVNENVNKNQNEKEKDNTFGFGFQLPTENKIDISAPRHIDTFHNGVELQAFKRAGGTVLY